MKSKISRRSFLRNIAAAGSGAAALGLLAGCSSSSTAASSGSTAAAEDKYTPGTYSASKTISYSEIGVSMTFDANSITACEITSSGEQDLLTDDKKTAMAKAIRERDKTARVVMVCGEGVLPYNRPALSDVVADGYSFAAVALVWLLTCESGGAPLHSRARHRQGVAAALHPLGCHA